MSNQNNIEVENVKKVKGITVSFNENTFLIKMSCQRVNSYGKNEGRYVSIGHEF